ncbi:hypothetical protein PoB_004996900 [Plakobranchus ocellatus]|uniref:Uncharacterized protein n=1 Tax=Plakobranchus ocellatus TaxID=259542 RepID=A0AAV4BTE7_9GAST|nr:hypothetical protein PoB_004996900 [Plakobranchus ocellatus]
MMSNMPGLTTAARCPCLSPASSVASVIIVDDSNPVNYTEICFIHFAAGGAVVALSALKYARTFESQVRLQACQRWPAHIEHIVVQASIQIHRPNHRLTHTRLSAPPHHSQLHASPVPIACIITAQRKQYYTNVFSHAYTSISTCIQIRIHIFMD